MLPAEVTLRDGRSAVIRHIRKDDYERVLAYFEGLSPTSRKWFCPHPFDEEHAHKIVDTSDGVDNVRLGAFADTADGPLVGYFYYQTAESQKYPRVGCGIIDEFHNQGLGPHLMKALIAEARRNAKPGLGLCVDKPNHRALRTYSKNGFRIVGQSGSAHGGPTSHHQMILDFEALASPYTQRCMYAHPIDWQLTHLTPDMFTLREWQLYLDLIQAAGANMLKIFIWPTQYYHPDFPETHHNKWRYELYREVLRYAHTLDLETHVGFAGNCVPPSVWQAHPDKRADEIDYVGIHLCWQRGKDEILQFSEHLIDYFADVVDGFVVWYADPGLCVCDKCQPYTPVVLDQMHTYADYIGNRAQLHHCPWWLWWMDGGEDYPDGGHGLPISSGIRRDILGAIPSGDWVLLYDGDHQSILIAREKGLKVLSCAFFMDPESGNETNNILPQTKFDQIEASVALAGHEGHGLMAYRLTPFTQFPQDWLFFRKQLFPNCTRHDALADLAAFLGVGAEFVEALDLLNEWWQGTLAGGYDMELLRRAVAILHDLVPARPEYLTHLSESADILLMLAEYGAAHNWQTGDDLVEAVQMRMEQTSTFTSYTHELLWTKARAYPVIRQRVRNWMKALQPIARAPE